MRMQFGVLTILLAVLAVSVLLGLTHNQIREYFYPKSALMSEREFWKVIDDAKSVYLQSEKSSRRRRIRQSLPDALDIETDIVTNIEINQRINRRQLLAVFVGIPTQKTSS